MPKSYALAVLVLDPYNRQDRLASQQAVPATRNPGQMIVKSACELTREVFRCIISDDRETYTIRKPIKNLIFIVIVALGSRLNQNQEKMMEEKEK